MGIEDLDLMEVIDILEEVSEYGKVENNGITRLLFDDSWIGVQRYLEKTISDMGLISYYDEVGNLYGRLQGDSEDTILTGSHIDTVVSGGKLDGQYGIIAGLVAINYLSKKYGKPKKSIEVVSMAEEEGSRFPFTFWGSKNIVGRVSKEEMDGVHDKDNIFFHDALKEAGFNYKTKEDRKDIKAFIELHVEQGGVLEIEDKSIGIVEHIVGQKRYMVSIEGEANHAGTTPMNYRKDALHGASCIICEIMKKAIEYGEPLVSTVGRIDAYPNTSNVVPGKIEFSLDIRHIDNSIMEKYIDDIMGIMKLISADMKLKLSVEKYMDGYPVPMDNELVNVIKSQCEANNLSYKMMHSGAGHDAQIMAAKVPTALIFVPSHKGISHNPEEYTNPKDLIEGVKALTETLYKLAYL